MPGVLDQTPPAPINPGLLSAQNLVSPNAPSMPLSAVQALSDAMRTGALTAQDIMDRTGELGKTHRKVQILDLKKKIAELSDDELVAAEHAQKLAAGDIASLHSAQAKAALPMVEPAAELQAGQIEAQKQALEDAAQMAKFPAAGFFDKAAPAFGLETPMTPDGKVDWAKKAKIGAQIALHNAEQQEAKDKLANITTHLSADGTILTAVTKQGQPVSPEEVASLQQKANAPFRLNPGEAAVVPATVAPVQSASSLVVPIATPQQRAQLVSIGVSPSDAATMDDKTVSLMLSPGTVTSQQPAVAPAPRAATPTGVGSVIPGVGMSLGPATARNSQELALLKEFNSEKSVQNLFQAQQALSSIRSQVEASRANPTGANDISIIFSFMRSIDPGSTVREGEFATAQNSAGIPETIRTLYNRALNGERLSQPQRENFLQSSERNVGAHAQTAESVRSRYLGQAKQLGISEDLFQPFASTPGAQLTTPSAGGGGPVVILSTGRKVRRGPDGNYYDAQ